MFAVKVKQNLLDERLDAGFYRPDFLEMDITLQERGAVRLSQLVSSVACGPFGGNAIADDLYAPEGVAFIRPINISSHVFDDSSLVRAPKESLLSNGLKVYQGTNLYFGRVGDPCVAVITGETSISPNIIIAKTDDVVADAHFLYAFSASKYGINQLLRQLKTVAQPTTSTDAIRDLLVVKPADGVQKYIGDKVRQAERLRSWAKAKRDTINSYFNNLFGDITLDRPEKHSNRISLNILVTRLNAEYYSHEYVQVEIGLKRKFGKLSNIGQLAPTVRTKERPTGNCRYFEIGDLSIARGGFEEGTFYKKGEAPNNAQRKFDVGDVAVSTRRPNRGAIAVIEDNFPENFYSVFLARLKPKNINFGYWLKEFLRHDAGKLLLQQRCTWTTYPVISEDDLETIPVPVLEKDWEKISELSRNSVFLDNLAKSLTSSSKLLVEALIAGHLSESLLIAAKEQLEIGNDNLDRSILNRLKTDGVDGKGQPLFADLDQLYSLLEQASEQ